MTENSNRRKKYEATAIDEDGSVLWMESDDLKEIEEFVSQYQESEIHMQDGGRK